MQARLTGAISPDVLTGIQHLTKAIGSGGVDPVVLELVHLRVSQINGCSPCVYAGTVAARKRGETDQRLDTVAAWRESPFFTDAEAAALELGEAATRVQDGAPGVTDPIWDAAATYFDGKQLAAIVMEVALTNMFNRINRAVKEPAGKTW
ncbi:MAG: carboxymuconolactone decarboxylase family protein [Nonomuraea sp.]|nr:carboxymuconolactone decarboxylase family protein [Nonomuraea sp.]